MNGMSDQRNFVSDDVEIDYHGEEEGYVVRMTVNLSGRPAACFTDKGARSSTPTSATTSIRIGRRRPTPSRAAIRSWPSSGCRLTSSR